MIRKILAPNPSIYTGPGTNTYLITDAGALLEIRLVIGAYEIIEVFRRR